MEGFAAVDIQQPVFGQQGELIGAVSMLISPERLFSSFAVPDMQGQQPEMMIMQKDGVILMIQTVRKSVAIPLQTPYQEYAGLLELAQRVIADQAGVGTCHPGSAAAKQVAKRSVWTTVGLHGTEWRLNLNNVQI